MKNKELSHRELLRYAQKIIVYAPLFRGFAVAVMDFAGGVTDDVFYLYDELRKVKLPNGIKLEDPEAVNRYTVADLAEWYEDFKTKHQKIIEKGSWEVKQNIDELLFLVEEYRNSNKFGEMLEFIGKARYFAPHNAMYVYMQKPNATIVLTAKKWHRDFHRQLKPNAQWLLTLAVYGPMHVMFDYEDTEPIPGEREFSLKEIQKKLDSELIKKQDDYSDPSSMSYLKGNLQSYGIYYDESYDDFSSYGGYLYRTEQYIPFQIWTKYGNMEYPMPFVLSVNKNLTEDTQFYIICHELGHLFCHHLFYDTGKERGLLLSHEEREFEAETVAWLVCRRHGVANPLENYLSLYSKNGKIPVCSLDAILKAVAEIEKMFKFSDKPYDKTWWYKNDKGYEGFIDDVLEKLRND